MESLPVDGAHASKAVCCAVPLKALSVGAVFAPLHIGATHRSPRPRKSSTLFPRPLSGTSSLLLLSVRASLLTSSTRHSRSDDCAYPIQYSVPSFPWQNTHTFESLSQLSSPSSSFTVFSSVLGCADVSSPSLFFVSLACFSMNAFCFARSLESALAWRFLRSAVCAFSFVSSSEEEDEEGVEGAEEEASAGASKENSFTPRAAKATSATALHSGLRAARRRRMAAVRALFSL